jgi:hypothetical protein
MLKKVILNSDVYQAYLTQALTTEREEVVSLLLGKFEEERVIIERIHFAIRKGIHLNN